jgi:hypothetical protein
MFSLIGGVVVEIIYKADIGFIIITGASVLFALATKLRTMVVSNGKYPKDLKHKRQSDWV